MLRLSAEAARIFGEAVDTPAGPRARVVGWAEGIHNRAEYLDARNAAIVHAVSAGWTRVIAAETNAALALATDRYLAGEGPSEPAAAAVTGMWSWAGRPLVQNAELLRWLRARNDERAAGYRTAGSPEDRIRFYGLDAFGDPAASAPGAHRDLEARERAQHEALLRVLDARPGETIFLFEQTEHLDPTNPGSLGHRVTMDLAESYRAVGAVWNPEDPTVRYPIGRYESLARAAAGSPAAVPVLDGADTPTIMPGGGPFAATLYAERTTQCGELG